MNDIHRSTNNAKLEDSGKQMAKESLVNIVDDKPWSGCETMVKKQYRGLMAQTKASQRCKSMLYTHIYIIIHNGKPVNLVVLTVSLMMFVFSFILMVSYLYMTLMVVIHGLCLNVCVTMCNP